MGKIAIVSDSSHDMTYEMGEKFNIEFISYYLQMGENHYKDQVDINSRQFYKKMENYEQLKTGIPPVYDVLEKLDQLKAKAYTDVLLITSSDKMTGMYGMYSMIKNDYEGLNLHIYNTNQIGSSVGLVAIYAAQLRDEGKSVLEIIKELDRVMEKTHIFALFRSLKYLIKGGRFNKYKGLIGMFLNINPLLTEKDGEIIVIQKHRGERKSLNGLVEVVKETLKDSKKYRIAIFSGNNEKEVSLLKNLLKEKIEKAELFIENELTPVLGVHGGPKAIGISLMILD